MTATDHYLIHGLALAVHSERAATGDAIRRRLFPYLVAPSDGEGAAPVDLVIDRAGAIVGPAGHGRPVYESAIADVTYDDDADCLTVDSGDRVQMIAELGRGPIRMSVLRDDEEAWAMCAHPLLTLCLLELMKRRGRYPLHAGGVVIGTGAVLVAGTSGAGKSTLTAALLRAGAGFLSDDIVFLQPDAHDIRVLSFADELDVTDTTAAMFPELADLVGCPPPPGRPKHQVRAEDRFGSNRVNNAWAVALVLPTFVEGTASALREADTSELLATLAPNVLLTEPASSQLHFDALAELVDSVPAYDLVMGRDPSAAAHAVLSALA
jgi:hypothetical protein